MAKNKGNTALTVIIIIAIIVIILAIAIPAYRSSQTHKHLNAALDAASGAKLVVEEAATIKGTTPAKLTKADVNWDAHKVESPYVASITISNGGQITVTTRDTGSKPDPVLLLTPTVATGGNTGVIWHCDVAGENTSIVPDGCSKETAPDEPAGARSAAPTPASSAKSE